MPGTKEKKSDVIIMRVNPAWKWERERCRDSIMPGTSLAEYLRRMIDLGECAYFEGRD